MRRRLRRSSPSLRCPRRPAHPRGRSRGGILPLLHSLPFFACCSVESSGQPRRPRKDPRHSDLENNVNKHLIRRVFLLLACIATASTAALAEDADIVGSWQVNITTGQAQGRTAPLVLRREGAN